MTDEELIEQLREVTGSKLFFTNTPNHLRLTAADRIEQLVATNEQLVKERATARGAADYWRDFANARVEEP